MSIIRWCPDHVPVWEVAKWFTFGRGHRYGWWDAERLSAFVSTGSAVSRVGGQGNACERGGHSWRRALNHEFALAIKFSFCWFSRTQKCWTEIQQLFLFIYLLSVTKTPLLSVTVVFIIKWGRYSPLSSEQCSEYSVHERSWEYHLSWELLCIQLFFGSHQAMPLAMTTKPSASPSQEGLPDLYLPSSGVASYQHFW